MTSVLTEYVVGGPAPVSIDGRYLYGAPAAGLGLEGEIALKPTRENATFPGYQFGLADEEETETVRIPLDALDGDSARHLLFGLCIRLGLCFPLLLSRIFF